MAALKDEYAQMVQQAYRMKLSTNPLLFVFAADDFSQAAMRFRLVQSYTTIRKEQVEQIEDAQVELAEVRVTLNDERAGWNKPWPSSAQSATPSKQTSKNAPRWWTNCRTRKSVFAKPKSPRKRAPTPEQRNQANHRSRARGRTRLSGRRICPDAGRQNRLGSLRKNQRTLPWPVMRGW